MCRKTAQSSATDLLVLKETSVVVVVINVGALGRDGGESASIAAVAISMQLSGMLVDSCWRSCKGSINGICSE